MWVKIAGAWTDVGPAGDLSAYAQKAAANTFTEDQTIEAGNAAIFGNGGVVQQTLVDGGAVVHTRNARYNGSNYIRLRAVNDASMISQENNGDLIYYTNSDAGNTVGSIISWAEKFRIAKNGRVTNAGEVLVRKTADEIINNSSTMQDDDALFFPIGVNETWVFEFCIAVFSGSTPDFKFTMNGTSGTATGQFQFIANDGATVAGGTYDSLGNARVLTNAGNGCTIVGGGVVVNGAAAGNLRFQWAQNSATAENTAVKAHSYIKATRVA